MITSYSRGHKIYFKNGFWYYVDNDKILDTNRACKKCGMPPTEDGHDACLGNIPNVKYACCGHGVEESYEMKDK